MDEEQEPAAPNNLRITSETTGFDLEPRPPGGGEPRLELVLRLAMMECHKWRGVGGRSGRVRRPRRMSRDTSLALDVTSFGGSGCGGGGGPDYLRSGVDCRRLIGRAIKHSLREEEEEEYRYLSPAHWDKAVPRGVERALAVAAQRVGGGTCVVRVDICITFEFVYSEPEALLRACVEYGGGDPAGRSGGDDDAPWCSICFEEMSRSAGEVTDLPGCTHGFHPWCIATWFHKASTCPVCWRDQLQYLPPDYRDLHDMMTIGRDSLPVQDYL